MVVSHYIYLIAAVLYRFLPYTFQKHYKSIHFMVQGPYWETNAHYSSTETICFLCHLRFNYCFHTCPSWLTILSQTNSQSKLLKICNLPSAHRSPKPSFFQVFCSNLCKHLSYHLLYHLPTPISSNWSLSYTVYHMSTTMYKKFNKWIMKSNTSLSQNI